jgi:hypothetical protein
MPEIRYFVVTQTREVKVTANSAADAVLLAEAAFEHGQMNSEPSIAAGKSPEGIWGNTRSRIREIEINAREGHS